MCGPRNSHPVRGCANVVNIDEMELVSNLYLNHLSIFPIGNQTSAATIFICQRNYFHASCHYRTHRFDHLVSAECGNGDGNFLARTRPSMSQPAALLTIGPGSLQVDGSFLQGLNQEKHSARVREAVPQTTARHVSAVHSRAGIPGPDYTASMDGNSLPRNYQISPLLH